MTITMNLAKLSLNFIMLNAIMAATKPQDPTFYMGALLAITLGFLMRVMLELKNNTFTWRNALIQAVMSLCLCYICVFVYEDIAPRFRIEYYLFTCSFCSVFIVGLIEKAIKVGFKGYARILLSRITADDPKIKEEEKP